MLFPINFICCLFVYVYVTYVYLCIYHDCVYVYMTCAYVYMYLVAFGEDGGRQSKSTLPSPSTSSSGYLGLSHIVHYLITQMNPHRTMVFSPHKCEKRGSGRWRAFMQGCRGELKLETSSLPTSRSFSTEQLVQRHGKSEPGTHLSL